MNQVNLLSLAQAHSSLSSPQYQAFINHYGIDISDSEVSDLTVLIVNMYEVLKFVNIYDCFYIGYKIQHISKEFDLLRFGEDYVINIELKRKSTIEKITKQLQRNKYYLNHINKLVHNFCFVVETNTLYKLDTNGTVVVADFQLLIQLLAHQNVLEINTPDNLFNPSDYLVSPFNSTDKFVNNQYFLTGQQEDIRTRVLAKINSAAPTFTSISGSAGTGKTLLTYDIVKLCSQAKRTLIVHCGKLNQGHMRLIQSGWNIIAIKYLAQNDLANIDLVVIDEAQRIYKNQLHKLIADAKATNTHCIFSYDIQQTLHHSEKRMNIDQEIDAIGEALKFKLSEKIRTNKEIASFIKLLFNNQRKDVVFTNCGNVDFEFFTDYANVKNYVNFIGNSGWEVLKWTPSRFDNEHHESYADFASKNSHEVIGQEFDNVAVVIDEYFTYDVDGRLVYRSRTYYDSVKMLFQNITRTRKKLKLVIIGNQQVLERCLSVLSRG